MVFTRSIAAERARPLVEKLPEGVLLEIFDAYRKGMKLQPGYETAWNGINGWFKLVHVCRRWRRVVLLSPSRLHLHLLFTPCRSSKVTMLKRLPPFPILVDYRPVSWAGGREENLALAAIRDHSRVRGITLPRQYVDMAKFLKAMSHPYPILESLEICSSNGCSQGLTLPTTFLSGSVPCLQRLTLRDVAQRCLSPLLSSATGLVELYLTIAGSRRSVPEALLIENLQRMPHLRRLEVKLRYLDGTTNSDDSQPPTSAGGIVPLSKLTQLAFSGYILYLEALVVVLAAPSLQHLDADVSPWDSNYALPHFCRFICDTNNQFITLRLDFSRGKVKFIAETKSFYPQPFRITIHDPIPLEELCSRLSGPFSTAEELLIWGDTYQWSRAPRFQWRRLFDRIQQVKIVEVPPNMALDVARCFQQDMGLLPALEKVKVRSAPGGGGDDLYASIWDAFEPLAAARQRVGRSIRLSHI